MALSQWCPGGVPVMFRRCSYGVSVVSRCRSAGPVVSGMRGVLVVSWSCPGGVPCCSMSSGVPVVSFLRLLEGPLIMH